ncbi:MAG: thermonuclease family protein [Candidatus Contendobacter sp.]|nr:thermonuclease family protein [Candidatus Contendobacter sp.]
MIARMVASWLVLALVVAWIPASAETLAGRVVGVHDGDTLTLLVEGNRQIKVRLAGIDAPELSQPYGQKAKQALSALAFGQEARIDSAGPDKYGRTLGTVYVGSINVNAALISQGAAWVYRQYPHDAALEELESFARNSGAGLWALPADQRVPPWEWRHGEKSVAKPESARIRSEGAWRCGSKHTCREMTSCDEARFYLTQCRVSRLDGDKDGRPCEALCRR